MDKVFVRFFGDEHMISGQTVWLLNIYNIYIYIYKKMYLILFVCIIYDIMHIMYACSEKQHITLLMAELLHRTGGCTKPSSTGSDFVQPAIITTAKMYHFN